MSTLPTENEKKWNALLRVAKNGQKKTAGQIPLETEKRNLEEEFKHYKAVLKKSLTEKNRNETKRALRELIKRRARLAIFNLRVHEADNFFISPEKKETEIKNYFIQCHKLITASALLALESNGRKDR